MLLDAAATGAGAGAGALFIAGLGRELAIAPPDLVAFCPAFPWKAEYHDDGKI